MQQWPTIADVDSKTLAQVAIELALWKVAQKIREVGGNNRGPWPDYYATSLGLDPRGAFPWCTSGMYCVWREAARQKRVPNPFPRTAKAVEVFNVIQAQHPECLDSNPAPGRLYILDHGKAWAAQLAGGQRLTDNGHIGMCIDLDSVNCNREVSGNTNEAGSREGNCWAVHRGEPSKSHGGTQLAWIDLSRVQLAA